MVHRRAVPLFLSLSLVGCGSISLPFLGANLDGLWRLNFTDIGTSSCVYVIGGRIYRFDTNCAGANIVLQNSQPAFVAGERIVWTTGIAFQNVTITIDVVAQSDGSLSGVIIQTPNGNSGQSVTQRVTMVRETT